MQLHDLTMTEADYIFCIILLQKDQSKRIGLFVLWTGFELRWLQPSLDCCNRSNLPIDERIHTFLYLKIQTIDLKCKTTIRLV